MPRSLEMGANSRIDHLTVCKGLDRVVISDFGLIGRLNWITGFPSENRDHFGSDINRNPSLFLGQHAAITNRHIIDCTNEVSIDEFSTIAGFRSQILTHSIDLKEGKQKSHPIKIGKYCFVGTGVIVLGGAELPDYSVLGAGSVLNKSHKTPSSLYAGAPARHVKILEGNMEYFVRNEGFVK
jgi:acetyltransferase-like isoleucine patch superfamily enzyme